MRPIIGTRRSAGADLCSTEDITIPAKGKAIIRTGYKYDVEDSSTVGLVRSRSGLAFRHGITAFHGTIDSDYKEEVMVLLFNHTSSDYKVTEGDKIAQLIIVPYLTDKFFSTNSDERNGGFGSTGK